MHTVSHSDILSVYLSDIPDITPTGFAKSIPLTCSTFIIRDKYIKLLDLGEYSTEKNQMIFQ